MEHAKHFPLEHRAKASHRCLVVIDRSFVCTFGSHLEAYRMEASLSFETLWASLSRSKPFVSGLAAMRVATIALS
jgi:hypothetical protein